jgi:hypothetical protein
VNSVEAVRIAAVISHADGGCRNCTSHLVKLLYGVFPEHDWDRLVADLSEDDRHSLIGYVKVRWKPEPDRHTETWWEDPTELVYDPELELAT